MAATAAGATTYAAACIIYLNTSALSLAETSRFPIRRLRTPAGNCATNARSCLYTSKNAVLQKVIGWQYGSGWLYRPWTDKQTDIHGAWLNAGLTISLWPFVTGCVMSSNSFTEGGLGAGRSQQQSTGKRNKQKVELIYRTHHATRGQISGKTFIQDTVPGCGTRR